MKIYTKVGVTASRDGLSHAQKEWVKKFLKENKVCSLHHGDCKGGDDELAIMFSKEGSHIVAYPGNSPTLRAQCTVNDFTHPCADNLVRNRRIVNATELVLAFPNTPIERTRSGTWFTIRYARKKKVLLIIINPDGTESK